MEERSRSSRPWVSGIDLLIESSVVCQPGSGLYSAIGDLVVLLRYDHLVRPRVHCPIRPKVRSLAPPAVVAFVGRSRRGGAVQVMARKIERLKSHFRETLVKILHSKLMIFGQSSVANGRSVTYHSYPLQSDHYHMTLAHAQGLLPSSYPNTSSRPEQPVY